MTNQKTETNFWLIWASILAEFFRALQMNTNAPEVKLVNPGLPLADAQGLRLEERRPPEPPADNLAEIKLLEEQEADLARLIAAKHGQIDRLSNQFEVVVRQVGAMKNELQAKKEEIQRKEVEVSTMEASSEQIQQVMLALEQEQLVHEANLARVTRKREALKAQLPVAPAEQVLQLPNQNVQPPFPEGQISRNNTPSFLKPTSSDNLERIAQDSNQIKRFSIGKYDSLEDFPENLSFVDLPRFSDSGELVNKTSQKPDNDQKPALLKIETASEQKNVVDKASGNFAAQKYQDVEKKINKKGPVFSVTSAQATKLRNTAVREKALGENTKTGANTETKPAFNTGGTNAPHKNNPTSKSVTGKKSSPSEVLPTKK